MKDAKAPVLPPPASSNWRVLVRVGFGIVFFTFGVLGGWSAVARLDAGVVAPGTVSVESYRKTVQHLEGGIVRELLVRDGTVVQEGDALVRLDPTRSEAQDRSLRQQLAVALALEARYGAQRESRPVITFGTEVLALRDDPIVALSMLDNQRQFESKRESLRHSVETLEAQIAQARKEIDQSTVEERTAREQLATIDVELPNVRMLYGKGLVAIPRLTTLEREQLRISGALQAAQIAQAKGREKIVELGVRIESLRQTYAEEAATALPDVRRTIGDLRQQIVIARDALQRIEIRAPITGTVQQLRIFTVGGVIKPGDPILDIVPASDTLVVRARVTPIDIDRVALQAAVEIRLPQFQKFQSQIIMGKVASVSRDSLADESNRGSYFAVEVSVDKASVPAEIKEKLVAGMTADVIIKAGERTVLEYVVAPFANRLASVGRER